MSTEEALEVLLSKVDSLEKKIEALTEKKAQSDLMDIAEAAMFLKRKPKTIYTYVSEGKIPYIKSEGRLLFSRSDLEEWLAGGQSSIKTTLETRMISLNQKRK